ncbi:cytochrome P450 87A3-like [Nicotiana tomentosiformis]|uniref:cytochrome P450 87A3-like n=1 Tax=Nicotiana tomentosiformis TaxID=4098 RepID=UPI00051AFEDD|nr:cytochrome P450 87A3-like [Nicotiana tomentosiformis]
MWLSLLAVALIVVGFTHWVYRWRNPKCKGLLPPGSMGLPIIGESIGYFSSHPLEGIPPFIQERTARYGKIFKTSLVGHPVVVSADPEVNYYVFQQEEVLFQCWYTKSAIELTGKDGFLDNKGTVHKYLRNLVLSLVGPDKLKHNHISEIDLNIRKHLHRWAGRGEVDVKEASEIMLITFMAEKILECNEEKALELREQYRAFMGGFVCFPINLPGTAYHASLQGRKNAMKMIKDIVKERKRSKEKRNKQDFLDHLLCEVANKETILTEENALNTIFAVLFAAFETTSAAIALGLKFLNDHPQVLPQLMEEHENIVKNREDKEAAISWTEYKSMPFTHKVVNEIVRLANIVPGIFRKVLKDVKIKGFTIPAGWIVVVCPPSVHLDSNNYEDPYVFNPWRWKEEELHSVSKKFMAFGGGLRLCAGADLAKLQISIFLHYLVTKYRWRMKKEGNIVRTPGLYFLDGLHIHISESERNKEDQNQFIS